MDTLTTEARSERMGRVRGKDTKPELVVRRLVHALGYRYRLHSRILPGKPDIVFPGRRKIIFVHGCFWHRHDEKYPLTRMPKLSKHYDNHKVLSWRNDKQTTIRFSFFSYHRIAQRIPNQPTRPFKPPSNHIQPQHSSMQKHY